MLIACCSTWHGRGNTSLQIALTNNLALNYNIKILSMHSQFRRSNLETAYMTGKENENAREFMDIGIDALEGLASSGELLAEEVCNYTKTIIPNRLDLLPGSKKLNRKLFSEEIGTTIVEILDSACQYYDLVVVDVNSGPDDIVTKKVLDIADVVILTLDQTENVIKEFFSEKLNEKFKNKKFIFNLGKYDKDSKCSKKYIEKNFGCNEVYCLPYLTQFRDSVNNHQAKKFFLKNMNNTRNEKIANFFSELNLISDKVVELLGNDFKNRKIVEENRTRDIIKRLFA